MILILRNEFKNSKEYYFSKEKFEFQIFFLEY